MTIWIPTAVMCSAITLTAIIAYTQHRAHREGMAKVRRELDDLLARQKPQWSQQ